MAAYTPERVAARLLTAEPLANPDLAVQFDSAARLTRANLRILLSGQGADAAFAGSHARCRELLKQ